MKKRWKLVFDTEPKKLVAWISILVLIMLLAMGSIVSSQS